MKKRGKVIKSYKYSDRVFANLLFAMIIAGIWIIILFGLIALVLMYFLPILVIIPIILFIPTLFLLYRRMFRMSNTLKDKSRIRIYENGDIRISHFGKRNIFYDYTINSKYLTKAVDDHILFAGRNLIYYYWDNKEKKEKWRYIQQDGFASMLDYIELRDFMMASAAHSKYKHNADIAEEGRVMIADPWKTD